MIKFNEKGEAIVTANVIRFPKRFAGKRIRLRVEFLDYKPRKKVMPDAKSQETNPSTL